MQLLRLIAKPADKVYRGHNYSRIERIVRILSVQVLVLSLFLGFGTTSLPQALAEGAGTVKSAGDNYLGQLGIGVKDASAVDYRSTYQNVTSPLINSDIVQVVASGDYSTGLSVALKSDGTVISWGFNGNGQLGNDNYDYDNDVYIDSLVPVQVKTATGLLTGVKKISLATFGGTILALKNDGTVWAWGGNSFGQLGTGYLNQESVAVPIPAFSSGGVKDIAAGDVHSLVVKNDGSTWGWGANYLKAEASGILGLGPDIIEDSLEPVAIPSLTANSTPKVAGVAAGLGYSVFLMENGTVKTTGGNRSGELGLGDTGLLRGVSKPYPTTIPGLTNVTQVSAGFSTNIVRRRDGTAWVWGQNDCSCITGSYIQGSLERPTQVNGISNVKEVAAGYGYLLAIKEDTSLWGWGINSKGWFGNGSTSDLKVPTNIVDDGVVAVAAGFEHSLVVTSPSVPSGHRTFTGDFNGDGKKDLLLIDTVSPNSSFNYPHYGLSVAKGLDNRSTTSNVFTETGWGVELPTRRKFFVADFDGDGKSDVLLIYKQTARFNINYDHYVLSLYTSNGDGTFTSKGESDTVWSYNTAYRFFVEDFDGDGKADVFLNWPAPAFSAINYLHHGFEIYRSTGTGSFARLGGGYGSTWGWDPTTQQVFVADFDGDGKRDVVLLYKQTARFNINYDHYVLSVFRSNGDGTFTGKGESDTVWSYNAANKFFVEDFDGDGKADVFMDWPAPAFSAINYLHHGFDIYRSTGTGSFARLGGGYGSTWGWDPTTQQVFVADFDGDGKRDVVLLYKQTARFNINYDHYVLSVFRSNGDGTFTGKGETDLFWSWDNSNNNSQIFAGDFDGDRRVDALLDYSAASGGGINYVHHNIDIFHASGTGFTSLSSYNTPWYWTPIIR